MTTTEEGVKLSFESPTKWHINIDLVESERFETVNSERYSWSHKDKPMQAQTINIAADWRGEVSYTFGGANLKKDGTPGQYRLAHVTTREEFYERCPQTYQKALAASQELMIQIREDTEEALANIARSL